MTADMFHLVVATIATITLAFSGKLVLARESVWSGRIALALFGAAATGAIVMWVSMTQLVTPTVSAL